MASALQVTGDKEVRRMFERLEGKEQKKIVRKATRAGAKIIQLAAKALAPKKSKRLARGIKVRALKRSRRRQGHQVIVTRRSAGISADAKGFYPTHQEFGLKTTRKMAAQPYLQPAADDNEDRVIAEVGDVIMRGIADVARKP